ncbi:hypothetical protein WDV06_24375 [Streptomyces racemochromogenes]|uniref:Secreted protein n=1 Tax=Streptomyces racemochromogenes TaxID=67353 RepID=A0ABW7PIH6_9ACTN
MFAVVAGLLGLALALARPAAEPGPAPHTTAGWQAPSTPSATAWAGAGRPEAGQALPARAVARHTGRAETRPGDGPRAVFTGALPERRPACAPGSGGAGTEPAVPARAGHEHGSVLVARAVPDGVRPYRAECVRLPVRGPDQRAPKPVELNVMRV